MKLTIDFEIAPSIWKIEPIDKIMSLGSCFSDEIGNRLKKDGFTIEINPFGVIFHPTALVTLLQKIILKDTTTTVVKHNDVFFSWDASGTFFAYSQEELEELFASEIVRLHHELKQTNVLMITFGTAFGYLQKETNQIVANCHKQPLEIFEKELTTRTTLLENWNKTVALLRTFNPDIKIIFTVSPVKHLKDGVIENLRSKSRLIGLASELKENYFPSFEIVQEELRDYRFYKEDGAHPNEAAINYVYERFLATYLSEEAKLFQEEIAKYEKMRTHRVLYKKSDDSLKFNRKTEEMRLRLKEKYPFINIEMG